MEIKLPQPWKKSDLFKKFLGDILPINSFTAKPDQIIMLPKESKESLKK